MSKPVHLLAGSVTVEHLLARAAPFFRAHFTARAARKLINVNVATVERGHDVVQSRLSWIKTELLQSRLIKRN